MGTIMIIIFAFLAQPPVQTFVDDYVAVSVNQEAQTTDFVLFGHEFSLDTEYTYNVND